MQPNGWNPNVMTPFMEESLRHGLIHDGWLKSQSLLVWGTDDQGVERNVIIDGEHRWKTARGLGYEEGPMVFLFNLPEREAKSLTIKMNQKRGAFDDDALASLVREITGAPTGAEALDTASLDFGFDLGSLSTMLDDTTPAPKPAPVDLAVPITARVKPGELYELGVHRLLCGDATNRDDVQRAMGGRTADMVWTDPPYGVAVVGGPREKTAEERRENGGKSIDNDDLDVSALEVFIDTACKLALDACRPGAAWYVAAPQPAALFHVFACVLARHGVWRQTLAWVKDTFVLGHSDYHYRHEPIFYGWKPGAKRYFVNDRTLDSVFEFPRPRRSDEHPSMKPIELVMQHVRNSTKRNDLVFDPFGGSGTTMLAAEQQGRASVLIEKSPAYCDVIVHRWEAATGRKAKLIAS